MEINSAKENAITAIVEQISYTVAAAKRSGTLISFDAKGEAFTCVAMNDGICATVIYSDDGSVLQLKKLHSQIKAISPSTYIMLEVA